MPCKEKMTEKSIEEIRAEMADTRRLLNNIEKIRKGKRVDDISNDDIKDTFNRLFGFKGEIWNPKKK